MFFKDWCLNDKYYQSMAEFDDAIRVLKSRERMVPREEVRSSWQAVFKRMRSRKVFRFAKWMAAALIVCCAGGYALVRMSLQDSEESIRRFVAENSVQLSESGDVVLMVPGQPNVKVATPNVNVVQSKDGAHLVDSENEVQVVVEAVGDESSVKYNQLLVPNGKRSFLTLADGSRVWVNSGSRIAYPFVFGKNREIYLMGEAYLEVARDASSPFIVHTDQCSIEVLGTVFNVSAYPSQSSSSVVLVEGSVNVKSQDDSSVTLSPGELVNVSEGTLSEVESVDVEPHISWVHNILMCKKESLTTVFDKLQTCYGKKIVLGPGLSLITVTGKLYLKDDFYDVLKSISYSVPLTYEEAGNVVYVYKRLEEPEDQFVPESK